MKKHLFLICKKHNRGNFGGVWMNIYHFIKLFIQNNIRNMDCQFSEVDCDFCEKEEKEAPL